MFREKKSYLLDVSYIRKGNSYKGFYIEKIYSDNNIMCDYWLYHKDFGVKMHMFGINGIYCKDIESFYNLDNYIDIYSKTYMII